MRALAAALSLALPAALAAQQGATAPAWLAGTWRGTSICTLVGKPACHDEILVLRLERAEGPGHPAVGHVELPMNKIVAGREEEMGTLACTYDTSTHGLECPMRGWSWHFRTIGDTLVGTLANPAGVLWRNVRMVRDRVPPSAPPARPPARRGAFPAVGIAVLDTVSRWCVAFPVANGALAAGTPLTIVLFGTDPRPALHARIARRRTSACYSAFPQPRWEEYAAYDADLVEARRPGADTASIWVTLAVVGDARWRRDTRDLARADLDGDGVPEEARRCRADEGEHFIITSRDARGVARERAHEYFDWGGLVDDTCGAPPEG